VRSSAPFFCETNQARGVRRCARKWGRWLGPSGGTETVGDVRIDDRRWRRLRVPTMNSSAARRCLGEGAKGVEGGEAGLFIAGFKL
jgi:hypothetical protein